MKAAKGTFTIDMVPKDALLDGVVNQFEFTKTWTGDIAGTSKGVMLAGGSPHSGEAGYIAFEHVEAAIDNKRGSFLFQQFGTMHDNKDIMYYEITPGTGTSDLKGLTGLIQIEVSSDGTHTYTLQYEL